MFTQICNPGINVSIASIAPQKVSKICNPPPSVQNCHLNQWKLRHMRGTCIFKLKWTEMPLFKTLRLGWFFTCSSLLQEGGEDATVLAGNEAGRLQEGGSKTGHVKGKNYRFIHL